AGWRTRDSKQRFPNRQHSRSLRSAPDGAPATQFVPPASVACIRATGSAATIKGSTTQCSWLSRSAARLRTSTGSWKRWRLEADLREIPIGPTRRRATPLRRPASEGAGGTAAGDAAEIARARRARDRPALQRALDAELRHRHGLLSA